MPFPFTQICRILGHDGKPDVVAPLVKRTEAGAPYCREPKIEALLGELEALPRAELVARCVITNRSDPGYVPSECLMYFVRASRGDNSDAHFERLYQVLALRVLRALPRGKSAAGDKTLVSLRDTNIREIAFDRFKVMLAEDRQTPSDALDYYEIRFDGAVANLRRDARKKVLREESRTAPMEFDEETNEFSAEIERAAGSFDLPDVREFEKEDFRSRLEAAIDKLPPNQSRVIAMLLKDVPFDSKDPDAMTIAKVLGKSEKTVRNYRDRAVAALRAALREDGDR
jgi:hypothetical protein